MLLRSAASLRQWTHPYNNKNNTGSRADWRPTSSWILGYARKPVNTLFGLMNEKFE
jgi:hypothetical protein